jgi:tetratricopeptide (TPR) repeat protein
MRKLTITIFMLLVCGAAFAQVRGTERLQGNVTDKTTGKPIAGATVTISVPSGSTAPIITKTDAKGRWSALGLTSGQWNVDITAPGYEPTRGSVALSAGQRVPPLQNQLTPEQKQAETPAAPVPTSPRVPKEAVDAITEAQNLLKITVGSVVPEDNGQSHTATAAEVKSNSEKAAADLEKALPQIPSDTPDLQTVRIQVQTLLAQAYYRAGDVKKSISILETLNRVDPFTTPDAGQLGRELLLANLYLENGQLDEAKNILDKLPAGAVSDATVYVNVGILFLNKKNPADAATYFSKAIDLDAKRGDAYYYRGLAEVQTKKNAEARADFEKVLQLSPDSPEARDSKQMLDSLPKK